MFGMRQTPPKPWTATNSSRKRIRMPTKGTAPYPAAPGLIVNDAQISDPIDIDWFPVLFSGLRFEEQRSEDSEEREAQEPLPTQPSTTQGKVKGKGREKGKEKAKAHPTPSVSAPGPSGWKNPETNHPPPPTTTTPHQASGSGRQARDTKSPSAGSGHPLPLHTIFNCLLRKIALPEKINEIPQACGIIVVLQPDTPEPILDAIRNVVGMPFTKEVHAVVCAITALMLRSIEPSTVRANYKDLPYLHNTVQTLLELVPAPERDLVASMKLLATGGEIPLNVAKAIVGEGANDAPEIIEAIAESLIAVIEAWGDEDIASYARRVQEAHKRKYPSPPPGMKPMPSTPKATPSTPKAASSTPKATPSTLGAGLSTKAGHATPKPPPSTSKAPPSASKAGTSTPKTKPVAPRMRSPPVTPSSRGKAKAKTPTPTPRLHVDESTRTFANYSFTYWSSAAKKLIRAPDVSADKRGVVGIYIHVSDDNVHQCWLNDPKKSDWIDVSHSYVNDDGNTLHPENPKYCLTSKRGPTFILLESLKGRKRKEKAAEQAQKEGSKATEKEVDKEKEEEEKQRGDEDEGGDEDEDEDEDEAEDGSETDEDI